MSDKNIEMLSDVGLKVSVELGRVDKRFREILDMKPGSVIELETNTGDRVNFLVNDQLVSKGEVMVVDGRFSIRMTNIVGSIPKALQKALGADYDELG